MPRRSARKVYNRAADTLRLCLQSLTHSKTAPGAKYRRLKGRLGAPKAIVAMAHHLTRVVCRILRATGAPTSKTASLNMRSKAAFSASNGLDARRNHSRCNSSQLDPEHRQFPESALPHGDHSFFLPFDAHCPLQKAIRKTIGSSRSRSRATSNSSSRVRIKPMSPSFLGPHANPRVGSAAES